MSPAGGPRPGRASRAIAWAAVASSLLSASACGGPEPAPRDAGQGGVAGLAWVPKGSEATHEDLAGVPGFDALADELKARVVARANRARCPCGCVGHAVNDCLHQREECAIALRVATALVDEARALQDAMGVEPPKPAEPEPPAATEAAPAAQQPGGTPATETTDPPTTAPPPGEGATAPPAPPPSPEDAPGDKP